MTQLFDSIAGRKDNLEKVKVKKEKSTSLTPEQKLDLTWLLLLRKALSSFAVLLVVYVLGILNIIFKSLPRNGFWLDIDNDSL